MSSPSTQDGPRAPGTMIWRLSGHLNTLLACGFARIAEEDVIELFVGDQEAAEGGMVTIGMRVPVPCGCKGEADCSRCGNERTVNELFSAWLAIRPGVEDGALLAPSVLLRGMRPVSFRVRLHDGA